MPALRIENLSKTFSTARARVTALRGLGLEVNDGELLVLLGPSGCGKTTLLRIIAGLEQADSGDVAVDSKSVLDINAKERGVGFAFQFPALLPQLTVEQNISLGPQLRGVNAGERNARTQRLARLLGIVDLLPRAPETLSGGQQQRVSLARALATEPRLLLLDEPLANLDPTSRAELREVIRSVQRELRVTTIYVTHDQSDAAAIADRIALLQAGELQQIGTAAELYQNPANLFVAEFFAPEAPNVLQGEIDGGSFRADNSEFLIPAAVRGSGSKEAICVIRPASLKAGGTLDGIIEEVIDRGWSTSVKIRAGGVRLNGSFTNFAGVKAGDAFPFSIDPAGLLLFDGNGRRLR